MNTIDITGLSAEQIQTVAARAAELRGERIEYLHPALGWIAKPISGGEFPQRPKPKPPCTLSRHLPGFRALREDEEWHRLDGWTPEMLPEGWRPLLRGELEHDGAFDWHNGRWIPCTLPYVTLTNPRDDHTRTRRALPEPPRMVPLTCADVPPGSVFRHAEHPESFSVPVSVTPTGVRMYSTREFLEKFPYELLQKVCLIARPGDNLPDGSPRWVKCEKPE